MDTDARAVLAEVIEVLGRAVKHHKSRDEFSAELHLVPVRYAPLTRALSEAHDTLQGLLDDDASS